MKKATQSKLLAVMVIALVFAFAAIVEYEGIYDIPFLDVRKKPTPITEDTTKPTYTTGIVTADTTGFDSLDIATSRTIGTNVKVYWYALRSGQWVLLGSGDAADINLQEQDRNTIYAVVSVPSGQSYYTDYPKTQSMNDRVQSVEYKDIDGDNVEEFIFRLNMANIPYATGTGKYNMPCFNVYLLTYDGSHALNSPADQTSIGTAKVTKYVEWYATISAEKKAFAVSKVVLKVNSSDISKVTLKKLNIPGIGYLDGSSFDQSVLTSEIKWTYSVSNLLYGADYIKRPVNVLNKFEFTTALELDLSTSDVLTFTLYVYYLDSTESQASLSDAMNVSA